jgi:hypothetical protein
MFSREELLKYHGYEATSYFYGVLYFRINNFRRSMSAPRSTRMWWRWWLLTGSWTASTPVKNKTKLSTIQRLWNWRVAISIKDEPPVSPHPHYRGAMVTPPPRLLLGRGRRKRHKQFMVPQVIVLEKYLVCEYFRCVFMLGCLKTRLSFPLCGEREGGGREEGRKIERNRRTKQLIIFYTLVTC